MIPTLLVLVALMAAPSQAQPPTCDSSAGCAAPVLHLDEALRIALEAQPTVRQARAQTQAAEAKTIQARAPLLPQLNGNLTYQRATANYIVKPGNLPSTVNADQGTSFATRNNYTGAITLSQLIWDFGQTSGRFSAARENATAQADAEKTSRLTTALSVRSAYFTARGARALFDVARTAVDNQKRHVDQAQGFFEAGARPKLDVVQAQSDLATLEVQRIQADNSYRTAKAQLNQAMGREGPGSFELADETLPPIGGETQPFERLLDEAVRARPEIAQLEAQIRAGQATLRSTRGGYGPSLGVSTTLNGGGPDTSALSWNWSAQATLTWPLFQGLLIQGQVAEAEATITSLEAQRDGVRQQVALELEQARLAVEAGKLTQTSANEAARLAHERLALAEGRYQTGAGSIIELTDAQTADTNASGQRVKAEYDLAVARAQLLKALGRP